MSKGPWKNKQKKIKVNVDPPPRPTDEKKPTGDVFKNGFSDVPPPLPPLPPLEPTITPASAADKATPVTAFDTNALKSGVAKTFVSVTKAAPYWANLVSEKLNFDVRFEFEVVAPEEGELWAEFAWPVIEKYMPKFKESPEYALMIVTAGILAGKIRVKKREETNHDEPHANGKSRKTVASS